MSRLTMEELQDLREKLNSYSQYLEYRIHTPPLFPQAEPLTKLHYMNLLDRANQTTYDVEKLIEMGER